MNKKRVLIVGPAWPLRGGLSTYNQRLCEVMNEQGHTCDILSFSLQYPSILFPGKTQYSTDPAPENLHIFSELNSINPFNWIRVGNRIRKRKYDVVVFRYWLSFMAPALGTLARLIKRNSQTTILAITDNIFPHERKFFDTALTRYFLSACDGFLTMSESVKKDLLVFEKNKPAVYVPHPMYDTFGPVMDKTTAKEILGLDQKQPYLLFFGFIRKYKGLKLMLEAMADERIRALNLKLVVAGEFYEDSKPYFELVESLGIKDRVIMSNDFIPNTKVSAYFCAADLVVQPYLNATQSGVTQIAYYYNKPMVVTNVGGLAELIPHEKVGYVTAVNSTSIADAIVKFYTMNKGDEFARNIEAEKQKFTWENLIKQLFSLTGSDE